MKKKETPIISPACPHPRETSRFVGNTAAEARLVAAYESGKLPHAWLMSGPKGVGKATLAYQFARMLLAAKGDLQTHPDLLVLETGIEDEKGKVRAEITVEEVRGVAHFLHLTPAASKYRIVIVDSADEMNTNAANALLKLLEEPPANAVLLLTAHAPGRILPTIRSRCRMLTLQPLSRNEVTVLLVQNFPDINPQDAKSISLLAQGAPGIAMALYADGGRELYQALLSLLAPAPKLDDKQLHHFTDKLAEKANSAQWWAVSYLLDYLLGKTVKSLAVNATLEWMSAEEQKTVAALAALRSPLRWLEIRDATLESLDTVERVNMDKKQTLLGVMEQLVRI